MNHNADGTSTPPGESIASTDDSVLDMRVIGRRDGSEFHPDYQDRSAPFRKPEGGRRKQRKPVRLRIDDIPSDFEMAEKFLNEIYEYDESKDGQRAWAEAEEGGKDAEMKEEKNENVALVGVTEEEVICPECGKTETCRGDLDRHLREAHSTVAEKVEKYPTKYHKLGSEFQEATFQFGRQLLRISEKARLLSEGIKGHESVAREDSIDATDGRSTLKNTDGVSNSRHGSKMHHHHPHHHHHHHHHHQRNENSAAATMSSRSPLALDLPAPLDLIAPIRTHANNINQLQQQRDDLILPPPPPNPPPSVPLSPIPLPCLSQKSSVPSTSLISAVPVSTPDTSFSIASGSTIGSTSLRTSATSGGGSGSNTDTEDYCNRCQKHFCNKYYLRKHKQDVHGVGPGSSTSSTGGQSIGGSQMDGLILPSGSEVSPSPCIGDSSGGSGALGQRLPTAPGNHSILPFSPIITSLPFVLPFPSGPVTNPIILHQPPITSSPSFLGTTVIPGFPSLPSLMFLNPFASPLTILKTTSPFLQATDGSNFASSSLNTLAELQSIENSAAESHSAARTNLLPTTGFSNDQSAHCELCRKEFCNTYFLKVHKREKHGIPLDEGDTPALLLKRQQSTLGLLEGGRLSAGSNEAEPGENIVVKNPNLSLKLPDEPFGSLAPDLQCRGGEDTVCRLCKKQLSNRYSLMMHLLTAHSIKPEGFGLASELLQVDSMNRAMAAAAAVAAASTPGGGGSGAVDANKLSDRVACDICGKEVCNKYFLKTHKLKVHGLMDPGFGIDSFRDSLSGVAGDAFLQDIRPLLQLDQMSQKHEDIAKTFMSIAAEIGLKNAVNEMKRDCKSMIDKDLTALSNLDKGNFKLSNSRKDGVGEDLSTAISLIAKNSYGMGHIDAGILDGKAKIHASSTSIADLFKQSPSGKHDKQKRSWSGVKHSSKDGRTGSHKVSEDSLKKSGIDPEAYCEICKKEFCSKYFLKTHKHKTHGFKTDPGSDMKPPIGLMQGFTSTAITTPAVINHLESNREGRTADPESAAVPKGSREVSTNGARVTCEICSKALCNKYFLKTHMLKIHGTSGECLTTPTIRPITSAQGQARSDFSSTKDSDPVVSPEANSSQVIKSDASSVPCAEDFGVKDHPESESAKGESEMTPDPVANECHKSYMNCRDADLKESTEDDLLEKTSADLIYAKSDWTTEPELPQLVISNDVLAHPDDLQPPKLDREDMTYEPLSKDSEHSFVARKQYYSENRAPEDENHAASNTSPSCTDAKDAATNHLNIDGSSSDAVTKAINSFGSSLDSNETVKHHKHRNHKKRNRSSRVEENNQNSKPCSVSKRFKASDSATGIQESGNEKKNDQQEYTSGGNDRKLIIESTETESQTQCIAKEDSFDKSSLSSRDISPQHCMPVSLTPLCSTSVLPVSGCTIAEASGSAMPTSSSTSNSFVPCNVYLPLGQQQLLEPMALGYAASPIE